MRADPARSNGLVHEHEFEPVRGLPEALPAGEQMLWQGSPDWRALARRAFHVRKLVLYFGVLTGVRAAVLLGQGASSAALSIGLLWMLLLGTFAVGAMLLVAWLSARATLYTVTNRRVVMRIGIVLTLSFNIPFKRIESAGLQLAADGSGDIPLKLSGDDRIAWLNLWPHARPWQVARPEPMLRCVPQAAAVAQLLAQAWSQQTGLAVNPAPRVDAGATRPDTGGAQPALQGR